LDRALATDSANERALFYRGMVLDLTGRAAEGEAALVALAVGADGKYADRARRYLTHRMRKPEAEA
jgi:hypothetical protein